MFSSETKRNQCHELAKLINPNTTLSTAISVGIELGIKVGYSFSNVNSQQPFPESAYDVIHGVGSLGWLKWRRIKNDGQPILSCRDLAENIKSKNVLPVNDLTLNEFYHKLTGSWSTRNTKSTILSISDAQLNEDEVVFIPTYSRTEGLPELLEMQAFGCFNPALTRSAKFILTCSSKIYQDLNKRGKKGKALDMGTGSGVLSMIPLYLGWNVTGVDIEETAVLQAKKNANRHGFPSAKYLQSDLFENLEPEQQYDIITFNPPCTPQAFEPTLPNYLRQAIFDPEMSTLDRFLEQSRHFLKSDGTILTMISNQTAQKSMEQWGEPNPVVFLADKYGYNEPKLIGSLSRPRANESPEIFLCYSIKKNS